jgi:hypothetical protein
VGTWGQMARFKQCPMCGEPFNTKGDVCDPCKGQTCGTCIHFAERSGPDFDDGKVRIESHPPDGWCTAGPTDQHWHWVEPDYDCNYEPSRWKRRVEG